MQSCDYPLQLVVCCLSLFLLPIVQGHGRLLEPPSRSSMWRFGFNNPINYQDNELFCGGFQRQWEVNNGSCGVCGDPWDGERQNEAGGMYANGIIVQNYKQGQIITVNVDLTANHLGYFEFRLCPHNSPKTPVTQECLDRHVLKLTNGNHRHHVTTARRGIYSMNVVLPADITCSQCVLQWKYNTGNSWGCEGGKCCVGCGQQEQFYGCADVAISQPPGHPTSTPKPSTAIVTSSHTDVTSTSTTPSTSSTTNHITEITTTANKPTTTSGSSDSSPSTTTTEPDDDSHVECRAAGAWAGNPRVTAWCIVNCGLGFCPSEYCSDGCRHLESLLTPLR